MRSADRRCAWHGDPYAGHQRDLVRGPPPDLRAHDDDRRRRGEHNETKPANAIPSYLQSQGYRIIPVNPRGGEILGERAYASLGPGPRDVAEPPS